MSYPTQEEELRAKEAEADEFRRASETQFLSSFGSTSSNSEVLHALATRIISTFDSVMSEARLEPFDRQEDIMAGLQKLVKEQINVIESRRVWAKKLDPATASTARP